MPRVLPTSQVVFPTVFSEDQAIWNRDRSGAVIETKVRGNVMTTRRLVLGVIMAVGTLSVSLSGLPTLQTAALEATQIEQVKGNLYVITGSSTTDRAAFSGGNTGVFIAEHGVIIVDTKLPGWGQVLLERIRSVTDKPVVTVINTHPHGDHTGSNNFFPEIVEIVAQDNTKTNMERMDAFEGENAKYLPSRTYQDHMILGEGRDRIELYYFGSGHTDGDSFIVYPALGVMQTGDMFPWRDAPFLDRSNGGSGVEFPNTLSKVLAGIDAVDTVLPGHIPVTTWDDLEEYQRFTADLLTAVKDIVDAGGSVDEAVSSIDLTTRYPGYASNRMDAAIRAIYEELE